MLARFFLVFVLCVTNSVNDEVAMQWNASKKLSWSDFKGPVEIDTDAVAVTASGITFSYVVEQADGRNTSFDGQVNAFFYPEKSWYIKEKGNDYILAHEQLHFDITELHARLFRYHMAQLEASQNIKAKLDKIHKDITTDLYKMQQTYDTESQNSINKEAQAKWEAYVIANLKKLEFYKSE